MLTYLLPSTIDLDNDLISTKVYLGTASSFATFTKGTTIMMFPTKETQVGTY